MGESLFFILLLFFVGTCLDWGKDISSKNIIQFENLNIPITQKLLKQKFPIKKYITKANIKKILLDVLKDFYNNNSLFNTDIHEIFFSKWKKNSLDDTSPRENIHRKFFKIVLLQE